MRLFRRVSGRTFQSLRVRNFRLYFIGQGISISGTWMQSVAQGWLVLTLPGATPVDLAVTIALPFLPMLLFGPFGGLLVDRSDKRAVLLVTQSGAGLLALALGLLITTGHVTLGSVWVIALLLGIVNLFDNPARQSFVQEMVGRELIPNAVALNASLINLGRFIGPAVSAILLATVSIASCFYFNAASYVAVVAALLLMRRSEISPIRTVERAKGQVRAGLAYAWSRPEIRDVVIAVAMVGLFAFNFTLTLPVLVKYVLHGSKSDYALINSLFGLGALAGGLFVAQIGRPNRSQLVWLATGFAVFMAGLAVAPTLWMACLLVIPLGAMSLAFLSTANSTLQLRSRQEMRGRVMALYSMAFLGTTPIGALVIGNVASASNARVAIGVGAAAALCAAGYLRLTAARSEAAAMNAEAATGTLAA